MKTFRDLNVYKKSFKLHIEIHELSMTFPKFEMYELGSQIRRSSNSVPANIAEGYNNQHTNIYLEGLNRSIGESQETQHHLGAACEKGYISHDEFVEIDGRYTECIKMLFGLRKALLNKHR
ncbi:four helix bundle protein [Rhodohalobacter sp. SW132]|uniref:four helix bundle protein n=1 Tax=Rhodohalobacter sp. SW132 TaxID=2293433 RepID=UPI000E23000A|nr:four helix bundle protein [Rhodohalobacter sp. SW132]REL24789.1 four helix bundle protein [Rhodohalobacter sp. SW132]